MNTGKGFAKTNKQASSSSGKLVDYKTRAIHSYSDIYVVKNCFFFNQKMPTLTTTFTDAINFTSSTSLVVLFFILLLHSYKRDFKHTFNLAKSNFIT